MVAGVDASQKSKTFESLGLERMAEEHGVFARADGADADRSPEEGDIVESILKEFRNGWVLKDSTYHLPSRSFILRSSPIAAIRLARVIERNNEYKVSSGSEANACDSLPSRFNIRSKEWTSEDVVMDEAFYVAEGRLNPDLDSGSPEFGELGFAEGFVEVDDGGGPEFVLSDNRSRVITSEELIIRYTMCRQNSSTPKLGDTSPASESPNRSVAQSDDKVWIMSQNLISETINFSGVVILYPSYRAEFWVAGDGGAAIAGEVFEAVPRRVEVEDVGAVELRVSGPDVLDELRVALGVVGSEPSPIGVG